MRVKNRRDAADRFAHQLQPGQGKFAVGLGIIERNDLVFEQLKKTVCIDFALKFDTPVFEFRGDRPAVVAVVPFAPPAIEHT